MSFSIFFSHYLITKTPVARKQERERRPILKLERNECKIEVELFIVFLKLKPSREFDYCQILRKRGKKK